MSQQSYDKNLQDLLNFPWNNLMKLVSGEAVQQFFLNWLDYIKAVEDSSGAGGGGTFSPQFKIIDGAIWFDPSLLSTTYPDVEVGDPDVSVSTSLVSADDPNPRSILRINHEALDQERVRCEGEIRFVNNDGLVQNRLIGQTIYDYNSSLVGDDVSIDLTITADWQVFNVPFGDRVLDPNFQNIAYAFNIENSLGNTQFNEGVIIEIRNLKLYNSNGEEIITTGVEPLTTWHSSNGITIQPSPLSGTQVQHLILTGAGTKPTKPAEGLNPGDDGWLKTDILPAVWAWNITDDIWYYNNGSIIKAFEGNGGIIEKRQERFSLIGHTTIPTAFESAVSISGVPKHLNLSNVKLINQADSSEIPILTDGALEEFPIAVSAGDYNYSLTYEEGKESGVLLINFS